MSISQDDILNAVAEMSVLQVVELIKAFEEKFGVSAAAASAGPAAAAAVVEEQTEFNVMLTEAGEKKVNVIKAVRELTGLGLKEAKAVVDGAPDQVLEAVSKDAADKAKAVLDTAETRLQAALAELAGFDAEALDAFNSARARVEEWRKKRAA